MKLELDRLGEFVEVMNADTARIVALTLVDIFLVVLNIWGHACLVNKTALEGLNQESMGILFCC